MKKPNGNQHITTELWQSTVERIAYTWDTDLAHADLAEVSAEYGSLEQFLSAYLGDAFVLFAFDDTRRTAPMLDMLMQAGERALSQCSFERRYLASPPDFRGTMADLRRMPRQITAEELRSEQLAGQANTTFLLAYAHWLSTGYRPVALFRDAARITTEHFETQTPEYRQDHAEYLLHSWLMSSEYAEAVVALDRCSIPRIWDPSYRLIVNSTPELESLAVFARFKNGETALLAVCKRLLAQRCNDSKEWFSMGLLLQWWERLNWVSYQCEMTGQSTEISHVAHMIVRSQ